MAKEVSPALGATHAVVIGAGIAGMAAAAALAEHFAHVTILERDHLHDDDAPRRGTAQARHPHVLLRGGLSALCDLLPGLEEDFAAAGAIRLAISRDVREEVPGIGVMPQRDFGLETFAMSRGMLERLIRARLLRRRKIEVRANSPATSIVAGDAEVAGVRLGVGDRREILTADLVVDASGVTAWSARLFKQLGTTPPPVSRIQADFGYATALFSKPAAPLGWKMLATRGGDSGRGALIVEIEGERLLVTLVGMQNDRPSAMPAKFREFAEGLWSPTAARTIEHLKLIEPIHSIRLPASTWYHYEQLPDFPAGLVILGDSWCRINPLYAMGMSVAALEAVVLRDLLQRSCTGLAEIGPRFFAAARPLVAAAWDATTIPDLRFAHAVGERPADLSAKLALNAAIARSAVDDPDVHRLLIEVRHLLKSASVLPGPEALQAFSPRK